MRDGERHAQVATVLPLPARPRVRPEPKQCGCRERCQEKGHGRARGQAHRSGGGLARIRRDRNRGHDCRKDCDRSDTDERPAVQQPRGSALLHVGPPPAFSDDNSGTCTVAMHCSPATARNWPIIYGRAGRCCLDSLTGRGGTGFASSYLARTRAEGGANGQDERQWQVGRLRTGSSPAAGGGRRQRAVASRMQTVVEAVWKPQRMNFVYRGYSTLYSCRGLQQKLEKILTTVGARGGIELRAYSCDDELAIARFQIALDLAGRGHAGERGAAHELRCAGRAGRTRARRATRERRGSATLPGGVEDDLVRTQPRDEARARRLRAGAPAAPAHPAANVGADRERPGALLGSSATSASRSSPCRRWCRWRRRCRTEV